MKISRNWLNDYIYLPPHLTPEKILYDLTMCTVEVESFERAGAQLDKVVLGKVEQILPHPKADRLRLAMTDIGTGSPVTIVCGGSNLREGMLTAVALPGARVRWHGEGELVTLEPTAVRGVKSEGMICASTEIGLADLYPLKEEHAIVDLTEELAGNNCKPGTPLADCLGLDDIIFEIDNKSLTNRPDLWGHFGIARELSAIYDLELKPLPTVTLPSSQDEFLKVTIADTENCSRYIGTLLDTDSALPSPDWLRKRLFLIGQRPISLLVDLTNYVMLGVGQPMHVFDYDEIAGRQIIVRAANPGEKILLLDGKEYELSERNLVIADGNKPVALAGIMGGEHSGVSGTKRRIVLEAACFEARSIRQTSSILGVRSDSSIRFEKGIDAERSAQATSLFLALLGQIDKSLQIIAAVDCFPKQPAPVSVKIERSVITSRIGREFSPEHITKILSQLGFGVKVENDVFNLAVPSYRATGDISIPEDIVEEVARLYGYDNLEFVAPPVSLAKAVRQPEHELRRAIREYLAYSAGMNEVYTYPWVEESLLKASGVETEECLQLFSPPSHSTRFIQRNLIPQMLFAIERNLRHFEEFSIFQIARVFDSKGSYQSFEKNEWLPAQPLFAAGAVVASSVEQVFSKAKGTLSGLFSTLRLQKLEFKARAEGPVWAAKGSGLALTADGKEVGVLGVLSLNAMEQADIRRRAVALFEFDLTELQQLPRERIAYTPLPHYPVVEFDIAMVFSADTSWAMVEETALKVDPLVKKVSFVDEYRGSQVPKGKKSIALRLELLDPEATLTSERITKASDAVIKKLSSALGGELRS